MPLRSTLSSLRRPMSPFPRVALAREEEAPGPAEGAAFRPALAVRREREVLPASTPAGRTQSMPPMRRWAVRVEPEAPSAVGGPLVLAAPRAQVESSGPAA